MNPEHLKLAKGFFYGSMASVFWGFHPVVLRYLVLEDVHPTGIAATRLIIASAVLFTILAISSLIKKKPILRGFPFQPYFWIAVAALALNFFLFHISLKYTIASDAILLEAFSPIIIFVLALHFTPARLKHILKDPKLISRFLMIVIAGSIGASLLIINDPQHLLLDSTQKFKGDLLAFAAMLFFGAYMFANHEFQRRTDENPMRTIFFLIFFTGLLLVPLVPWPSFLSGLTPLQWMWILILSVSSTSLAYLFWQLAAKTLEAVPLALLFFSLSSVFNVAIESVVFEMEVSPKLIFGGLLILTASVTTQMMLMQEKNEHYEKEEHPTL